MRTGLLRLANKATALNRLLRTLTVNNKGRTAIEIPEKHRDLIRFLCANLPRQEQASNSRALTGREKELVKAVRGANYNVYTAAAEILGTKTKLNKSYVESAGQYIKANTSENQPFKIDRNKNDNTDIFIEAADETPTRLSITKEPYRALVLYSDTSYFNTNRQLFEMHAKKLALHLLIKLSNTIRRELEYYGENSHQFMQFLETNKIEQVVNYLVALHKSQAAK